MHKRYLSLLLILLLSFTLGLQGWKHDYPLSWDVWYHLTVSRQFSKGGFLWDAASFGPEGRPHTYPPLFHAVTAFLYVLTGVDLVTLAKVLTPFIFSSIVVSFYLLVKEVFDEKTALLSCLFASVSPVLLDRGITYTPETLSFVFINLGLFFFWKSQWKVAGIFGGLLILTHGLSSVVFFSFLFFYCLVSLFILKENYLTVLFGTLAVSLLVSSFWILRSYPSFVPKGFAYPLTLYPEKLGWIQVLLAFLGLTYLSREKKSVFIISFAVPLLLLSQYSLSLPYRFVEFIVFPISMLAGMFLSQSTHGLKAASLVFLFAISFAQGYWSVEKYQPVVTSEEVAAFSWLNLNSVKGYTVISEWKTSPILAFFSERTTVKGGYQFGAPMISERTEDTEKFYAEYPEYLFLKYEISCIFYGIEERSAGYTEPPFDKVYSTSHTGFYHR